MAPAAARYGLRNVRAVVSHNNHLIGRSTISNSLPLTQNGFFSKTSRISSNYALQMTQRYNTTAAGASGTGQAGASGTSTQRPLEVWEEVELNRPRAPTLEGYQRPKGAPEQFDIDRTQFHEFMRGKPGKFGKEFRIFLTGVAITTFIFAEIAFTVWKLKPDNFEWVEEERARAAKAKAKIDERRRLANLTASEVESN